MASINDIISNVQSTRWQKADDFQVEIAPTNKVDKLGVKNILGIDAAGLWDKCVISFNTPEITNQPLEQYLGGEFRVTLSKPQAFRFSMRFRDFDAGELRRYFHTLMAYSFYNYPADSHITVKIRSTDNEVVIFESSTITIENVSSIEFDSQGNAIQEFSVAFVSPKYSDSFLVDLGGKEYIEKFQGQSSDSGSGSSGGSTVNTPKPFGYDGH
ncbi:MAG: hypothetical protein J7L63_04930 [Thermoplasmata archaeon]|nr:hypothetical protein [Thermoplasmata archaeon]